MGSAASGMEHDGPIADACKMPSFIGSFEEGSAKLSRNLPSETSPAESPAERSVRDLSRRVSGSSARSSPDGGEREPSGRSGEDDRDDRDAGGNSDNGNAGGERRRRASAVEILRRNLGVCRSPSLRPKPDGRTRRGAERERREGNVDGDVSEGRGSERAGSKKSDPESGDPGMENEPTTSDLTATDLRRVALVSAPGSLHCQRGDGGGVAPTESPNSTEHVYCTVYYIADDRYDEQISDGESVAGDAPESDARWARAAGASPEPAPYTLDDLADAVGDASRRRRRRGSEEAGEETSCRVCLEAKPIAPLPCCGRAVCDECLKGYVSSQVRIAKSDISCPIPECSGFLEEGVVISHLANEDVAKYRYLLELSQLDSGTKPCPQCSQFTSLKEHDPNHSEHKYKIQCSNCKFVWCFKCHAPWHNGLKCRDYRRGDKLLRTWACDVQYGQRNAQKCPQCKIHIQRTEGCDHMTCTQCNTNFCYRCGERYRQLRFFGDHTSNLSVFGCKYRYLPDKPHLRRLIRGSICAAKVLVAPVVIVLVLVLGAHLLIIGLFVFPIHYVCKRWKKNRTEGSGRWI